jgi:hypothetical protein
MNAPTIDPNIQGEIPDLHAKRVVTEMLQFLDNLAASFDPALKRAISQPVGGSPLAQRRYVDRVLDTRSPAIIDVASYFGKRCRFGLMIAIWYRDPGDGASVSQYFVTADGPGTEKRTTGPLWRISNHALTRLVQRSGATDVLKLLAAMRAMGKEMTNAMAGARLYPGDGKVIYVKFIGGIAVMDWPKDSELALVKTILSPDMAHPLPGLH